MCSIALWITGISIITRWEVLFFTNKYNTIQTKYICVNTITFILFSGVRARHHLQFRKGLLHSGRIVDRWRNAGDVQEERPQGDCRPGCAAGGQYTRRSLRSIARLPIPTPLTLHMFCVLIYRMNDSLARHNATNAKTPIHRIIWLARLAEHRVCGLVYTEPVSLYLSLSFVWFCFLFFFSNLTLCVDMSIRNVDCAVFWVLG